MFAIVQKQTKSSCLLPDGTAFEYNGDSIPRRTGTKSSTPEQKAEIGMVDVVYASTCLMTNIIG